MVQTLCKLLNILTSCKAKKVVPVESDADEGQEEPEEEEAKAE